MNQQTSARCKALLLTAAFAAAVVYLSPAANARLITTQEKQTLPTPEQVEFFEQQVRPILSASCGRCHNAKAKVAELDLTTAEGFARGGESGALVDRAHPEASRLLTVVSYNDKLKMPPSGKLKDEELAVLLAWVKMGAPWPNAQPVAESKSEMGEAKWTGKTTVRPFTEEEKKFWAFQPVAQTGVPSVANKAWIKSPIDAFILQKLEAKKLAPAPATDKLTLLRRASFDLTGLPPTEKEIADFLADSSPDAFKKVVDRLLDSPRYGEKWGRNWLDVARYADSTGNDEDHRYPHAWRYRDYVIEAFNRDLPYDQFVREQVAGDLLPAPDGKEVNRRGIIATSFLALGPKAIAQQDKRKMLYDVYDEQVDVLTKGFLGLTVACARCHNHKFDPILTKDYYSMVGIFANTRSFTNLDFVSQSLYQPLVPKAEYDAYTARKKANAEEIKQRDIATAEIIDEAKARLIAAEGPRLAEYLLAARAVYNDNADLKATATKQKLDAAILERWVEYLKPGKVKQHLLEWREAPPANLNAVAATYQQRFQARLAVWNEKLTQWRAKRDEATRGGKPKPERPTLDAAQDRFFQEVWFDDSGPFNITAVAKEKKPGQTDEVLGLSVDDTRLTKQERARIAELKREIAALKKQAPAEPDMACAVAEGEPVEQHVFIRGDHHSDGEPAPKAIPAILVPATNQIAVQQGSGRLQLAEWLTRKDNPLTARVMANRIWQWHFGEGLVRTPDNFGKMGERPTHPELLDYLAAQFVESGWSIKAMHRLLMNSSVYQMSSEISEVAFTADPENKLFSRFNRRRLGVEEMRDALLYLDGSLDCTIGGTLQSGTGTDGENDNKRLSLNPEKLNRRTVYLPLRRANLPTLLNLFDFGDATTPSGKRQLTNVATQALFWMNSEFLTDRSQGVAQSLLAQKQLDDVGRVRLLYAKLLNRAADPEEIKRTTEYITAMKQKFGKDELTAWQSLCRVLLSSNDFVYVD